MRDRQTAMMVLFTGMYDPSITGESVVEEGTEVRLECKADSSYPISYKWLKNGERVLVE